MKNIGGYRKEYHKKICSDIIRIKKDKKKGDYYNFADVGNFSSIKVANGIVEQIGSPIGQGNLSGQTIGGRFETITREFIQKVFDRLLHIRPGKWTYRTDHTEISSFDQYAHLADLMDLIHKDRTLSTTIGSDYIVKPDIIIARTPLPDNEINKNGVITDGLGRYAAKTPIRSRNNLNYHPILHASISCKWTIRSDRAQNTRTEALNLIRNRKGPLPHVAAVTAEPLPTRIAALALGTGDLDCVYHFALNELVQTLKDLGNEDQLDSLMPMIEGRRLRDISDLPFDLAI